MTDPKPWRLNSFKPRKYQLKILRALDSGIKRAVWVCHRRAGKDLTIWNWLIKTLLQKKQTAFYLLPTYSQAKKIIWEGMTKDGVRFMEFIPKDIIEKKSEAELSIRFTSGSLLQLVGSDNYDRLVGTNPSICVFSEMALQNPTAWEYMRPILAENDGTAIFISTPRGKNAFWDLLSTGKESEKWFTELLTVDDTGAVSKEAIEQERASGMSEEMIQQEFYCSFDIGQLGSYYGKLMDAAQKEGRICNVPVDANHLVYTAWDIGYTDATSITFFQRRGNELLIVDHYENVGYSTAHYVDVVKSKGYDYGLHFSPHDGAAHNTTGTTFVSVARELALDFTVIPNKKTILEGVELVRGALPRMYFDKTKCEYLVKCLLQYHAEWDDNAKVFRGKPKHDWSSHAADSLRYMCLAFGYMGGTGGGMTPEELKEMKRKHGIY